jgi:hypothetical protein
MIFGSLTEILDISVSNVTEATSFFHAHIIMYDLLFSLCSIIVAIDSVFFARSLVLRDRCRAAMSTAMMSPSTPRLVTSLGGYSPTIMMATWLEAFIGAPSVTGSSAPPTSTDW